MSSDQQSIGSRWPHRFAVLMTCATFPLIWVGGLVTTYDAGMAVPDWPTTYGYNLFLYPWQTWLAGPWDLFIEHGHRLLGATVGMITIAFVLSVFFCDSRLWMRFVAIGALAAVIGQGVLGGQRVLFDDRQLALIHGCVGPAFFALAVALCVFTSRVWRQADRAKSADDAGRLHRLTVLMTLFAFIQLILGAHLRHVAVDASPDAFRITVFFHLLIAAVVTGYAGMMAFRVWKAHRQSSPLLRPSLVLVCLVGIQILLGAGSWVAKYSWPSWLGGFQFAAGHTVHAQALLPSLVVTLHVAMGSMILATSVLLMVRSLRLVRAAPVSSKAMVTMMELVA